MKLAPLLTVLLFPLAALGRDTAYHALRAIGAERDQALLNHVIEVKGRDGAPQPEKWTVVLDDPLARGGVREIEVANGHIVSERTPVKAYSGISGGVSMNFQKLNLDSEGAFKVAEDEARRARIGFESVDYVLRCDEAGSAPTWVLQLLDARQHSIGSVRIAADNGTVLARDFGGSALPPEANAGAGEVPPPPPAEDAEPREHTDNLGHRIDRTLHRTGASLEEFFTGKRTLDRRFRGED